MLNIWGQYRMVHQTIFACICSAALIFSSTIVVYADNSSLPQNGQVMAGDAQVGQPTNDQLLITQTTSHSIINWDQFSIGTSNSVHFKNGTGATLNRVMGNSISTINGSLNASGSVYLINDNGIIIGEQGIVQTGGSFIASTLDIGNNDFLNGGDNIFIGNSNASIVNRGRVESLGGDVAFFAQTIINEGVLIANDGVVGLAAGREILMRDFATNDGKFVVKVGDAHSLIEEKGLIEAANVELRANGGNIYALAGNHNGSINATGAHKNSGRIFLTAGAGKVRVSKQVKAKRTQQGSTKTSGGEIFINANLVNISGLLDASGTSDNGGNIDIGGTTNISLNSATLDASGANGGRIRVGGEYQGGHNLAQDEVENVLSLYIDNNSSLTADATNNVGNGGTVIAWSDDTTIFDGLIFARGGSQSGNGGMVETSSKAHLGVGSSAHVNTLASNGNVGSWLLDPTNVTILNTGPDSLTNINNAGFAGDLFIDASVINGAGADITILASNDITFNEAINTNVSITADAGHQILINQEILSSGNLTFSAPDGIIINTANIANTGNQTYNHAVTLTAETTLTSASGGDITFNGTLDGSFGLSVDTTGALVFAMPVGSATPLSYIDAIANVTQVNGGSVSTINEQYYDAVNITGETIFKASSALADIYFLKGLATSTPNSDLTVMAGLDIAILDSIQFAGTGNINLVAGWDGTTAFNATQFKIDNLATLQTQNIFGNNDAIIGLGDDILFNSVFQNRITLSPVTNDVKVGSSDGETNVFTNDLYIYGGLVANFAFAQLGFETSSQDASGDINVYAVNDIELETGITVGSYSQIGHGGAAYSGELSGNINIRSADDLILAAYDNEGVYAQVGHGGLAFNGSSPSNTVTGNIDIKLLGRTELYGDLSASAKTGTSQIGHGGASSKGTYKGNIGITTEAVYIEAGAAKYTYSQIGHGGFESNSDQEGNITIISGVVEISGGSHGDAYAQIGHGDATNNATGTRKGNIDITASNEFSLVDNSSVAWVGHQTTSTGAISDASLHIKASGFDQQVLHSGTADLASKGNSTFATDVIINALQGGEVVINATDTNLSLIGSISYNTHNNLTLRTKFDYVLDASEVITNADSGDIVLVAGRNFLNQSTLTAPLTTSGRYYIYSKNWNDTLKGGMAGNNLYNRAYDANLPTTISQSGNLFIFSDQPVLTITGQDTIVDYNGAIQTLTGFDVAGMVDGDSRSYALSSDPNLSGHVTAGTYVTGLINADAASSVGYAINIAQGQLVINPGRLSAQDKGPYLPPQPIPVICIKSIFDCEDINSPQLNLN